MEAKGKPPSPPKAASECFAALAVLQLPNPFSRGWNNLNQSFLKLSHLCLLSSSGSVSRRRQNKTATEAVGSRWRGIHWEAFFFLGKYFPAAGCGDSKHSCRGWRGEASLCEMAGAPGAAPALPFPGCNPTAVPEGSGPGRTKAFYASSTGGCFCKGEKRSWRGPLGISRGALAAPCALSSPGKREDC